MDSSFTQTERAFQKQLTIPVVRRKNIPGQRKLRTRHYREVGLGFKTPKEVFVFYFSCANLCFISEKTYLFFLLYSYRQSMEHTSTKNAHSLVMYAFVVVSWTVLFKNWRCNVPLSFDVTTCTTFGSTVDLKSDTRTCRCICLQLSGKYFIIVEFHPIVFSNDVHLITTVFITHKCWEWQ